MQVIVMVMQMVMVMMVMMKTMGEPCKGLLQLPLSFLKLFSQPLILFLARQQDMILYLHLHIYAFSLNT